ncbi:hypothetical protein JOF40_001191 [Aeromicrobium fastidiosum]|nr:hypothetical protein [Aeromicrobium fastidiosum]
MDLVACVSAVIAGVNAVLLAGLVVRYRREQQGSQPYGQLEQIGRLWEARADGVGADRRASAA